MKLDDVIIDDEFEALCPQLTDEERQQLQISIELEGFRDAIVVWGKILIDGHNRFDIWHLLYAAEGDKKPPTIVQREFKDRNAAMEWIIRNQFGRRNLTAMQRAELAIKLKSVFESRGKDNMKRGGGSGVSGRQKSDNPVDTKKELAAIAGVSHDTIAKVETILKSADKETVAKVRSGQTSINAAAKSVKQPKPAPPSDDFLKRAKTRFNQVSEEVASLGRVLKELGGEDVGRYVNTARLGNALKEIRAVLKECVPVSKCQKCSGKGCILCKESGYVTQAHRVTEPRRGRFYRTESDMEWPLIAAVVIGTVLGWLICEGTWK